MSVCPLLSSCTPVHPYAGVCTSMPCIHVQMLCMYYLLLYGLINMCMLPSCMSVHPCACVSTCRAVPGCCKPAASLCSSSSPSPVMPETWAHSHLYSQCQREPAGLLASTDIIPTNNLKASPAQHGPGVATGQLGWGWGHQGRATAGSPKAIARVCRAPHWHQVMALPLHPI